MHTYASFSGTIRSEISKTVIGREVSHGDSCSLRLHISGPHSRIPRIGRPRFSQALLLQFLFLVLGLYLKVRVLGRRSRQTEREFHCLGCPAGLARRPYVIDAGKSSCFRHGVKAREVHPEKRREGISRANRKSRRCAWDCH